MKNICELLKEFNEISDYRIISSDEESYELFFVHDKLETVRATNTKEVQVTVYVDHKKFRGNSSFTVSAADSETDIINHIKNAIEMAKLINNKKFSLPKDEALEMEVESNFKDYDVKKLGSKMYNVLMDCTASSKAKLNATEIFIYKTKENILNSQNLNKTAISYKAMIETIPTFDTKRDSVELYTQLNFSSFSEKWLKDKIKQALKDVTARSKAAKPDYEINTNILIRPAEINELISNIAYELNYSLIYNNNNLYKKGDDIQENSTGDKLNVTLLGGFEGSAYSRAFDYDGITLKKQKVIKDGICVKNYGSNVYAQYLHKKPTGNLNHIELKRGSKTEKELKSNPYLECASFSGLQVDLQNDYIGGEVRLAYYYDGNKVTPVTGISISGKISDVLKSIELSNKVTTEGTYKGPNYALLKGMKTF